MKIDPSQQISATYARNNFKEMMNKVRDEGMQIIIHKSQPAVVVICLDDLQKMQETKKSQKKKKFDLKKIRENSTFNKYRGCMSNTPDFKGLTSVQIAKKWTDYVD